MAIQAQSKTFPVLLSVEAHEIAQKCCRGLSDRRRAKQVYLNTLAIHAVEVYLRCMGWETDWRGSDSRNPLMLKFTDVADLEVKGIGKLECRSVLPEDEALKIPPEVWEDRIGYVAVRLDRPLREATVLGFTRAAAPEVSLDQLQPLDGLLAYLSQIQPAETAGQKTTPARLSQWVQGIWEGGWRSLEEILAPSNQYGWARGAGKEGDRHSAHPLGAAKIIDFGLLLNRQPVALALEFKPTENQEVDVRVRVCPMGELEYLPPGLRLKVILNPDGPGEDSQEVTAREKDNWIQLEFDELFGSKFKVEVSWEDTTFAEELII